LAVKGHRPEELDWMKASGRSHELDFYFEQYARIEKSEYLDGRVEFSPFDNRVSEWYERVDFILSPSDHESFHYALADGVISGCFPVIWPWAGAAGIYPSDWVVEDIEAAAMFVSSVLGLGARERDAIRIKNRDVLVQRYGEETVFAGLTSRILGA
jgi:hypothetical protein